MNLKNPLFSFIFILFFCLIVFGVYSFFWNKPIKISEIEIKQSQLGLLKSQSDTSQIAKADSGKIASKDSLAQKQPSVAGKKTVIDSSRQTILLTGDSMSEGLMFPFMKYAKYNDYNLQTVIWYSSSTLWWAEKDSLRKLIDKYKPTFIIFTLGSNELFIRNIKQEREKYVQDILEQAGTVPFVWIGPPNWKKDTGINDMLLANLGEDRFFISKDLTFERANDGRHPSRRASVIWADTISKWIMQKCRYPIKLEKPKLPQEIIAGSWLVKTGEKPLFAFTKDSVQIADSSKLFKYYFNGTILQIQNSKRPYRASVIKLSRDSLVLQDWEKKLKLGKSFQQ